MNGSFAPRSGRLLWDLQPLSNDLMLVLHRSLEPATHFRTVPRRLTHHSPEGPGGLLEPCPARTRAAFRNRKYFRTNCPSRGATSGPPQIQHAVLRLTVSGPSFALTSWYRALQAGQRKNGRFVRTRHERPQRFCLAARGEHPRAGLSKAGDLYNLRPSTNAERSSDRWPALPHKPTAFSIRPASVQ